LKKKDGSARGAARGQSRKRKMLKAFVRCPRDLFVQPGSDLLGTRKKFHSVSFISAPDAIMHTVCVDWLNSVVTVFDDANDAMNNIPSQQRKLPLRETPPTATECVRETFEYLRRGHSLHHPACRCRDRGEYCSVGTTGQGRSIKDVERELGVCSLYGLVRAGGETLPLVQVLVRLAGMTLYDNNNALSSALCCVPTEINSADDILAAARALYPRPYIGSETGMGDLARLESRGLVRLIKLSEQQYAVFWCDWWPGQAAADADIRKLWDAAAPRALSVQSSAIQSPKRAKKRPHRLIKRS
jgi:hypothetical protein